MSAVRVAADDLLPRVRELFALAYAGEFGADQEHWPRDDEPFADWVKRTGGDDFEFVLWHIKSTAEVSFPVTLHIWRRDILGEADPPEDAGDPWDRITPAHLHRYVADRTPRDRFGPVEIAGHVDPAAGTFLGLRGMVRRANPAARCAPSDRLRDALGGHHVRTLWERLAWRGLTPPPLRRWPWSVGAALMLISAVGQWVTLGWAVWRAAPNVGPLWGAALIGGCLFGSLLWYGAKYEDPLPRDLRTFRDLAEALAQRPPRC